MTIAEGYGTNLGTLIQAAKDDNLCLLECTDKAGNTVIAVCAINFIGGAYEMVPLAKMFDGNPYEELQPPM